MKPYMGASSASFVTFKYFWIDTSWSSAIAPEATEYFTLCLLLTVSLAVASELGYCLLGYLGVVELCAE